MEGLRTLASLDPRKLFVLPMGVGYAFTRRFYHSSFLVVCGGKVTMVDAPAPLRRVLWAAGRKAGFDIDLQHIDNLYLTHLHGDHCNGVEEFAFWRMFRYQGPKARLFLLRELRSPLWFQRLYAAMGSFREEETREPASLETWFDVHDFTDGQKLDLGIPGLELEPRMTRHMVPCAGFKLRYNGFSLGYSADTPFDQSLIDFLSDADLIIHETSPGSVHTPLESLVALPAEIRAKMLLTHLEDDFDVENSPIPTLREGNLYEVGAGREAVLT